MDYISEDLNLPNLDKKKYSEIITESAGKKRGYQRHGINQDLQKRKQLWLKLQENKEKNVLLREARKMNMN